MCRVVGFVGVVVCLGLALGEYARSLLVCFVLFRVVLLSFGGVPIVEHSILIHGSTETIKLGPACRAILSCFELRLNVSCFG